MPPLILASKFWDDYGSAITAAVVVIAVVVLVVAVNRAFTSRARAIAEVLGGGELSPEAGTRLRFLRRLIDVVIVLIGAALVLAQFTNLNHLAATILASTAIAAAVIGFAARQVLANAIAGLVLAVTQPLRIGDLVTFEDQTGTVEDITLTYTWLRTGSDARIIVPNERLAAGILRNDSIRSPTVALEVSIWLAADADETAALEALETLEDVEVARIAEATAQGVRVVVAGPAVPPRDRIRPEAELRAEALRAIREAGVPRAGSPG